MPAYSNTPLVKKLGLKEGHRFYVKNSPRDYADLLGTLPDGSLRKSRLCPRLNFVHLFTDSRKELTDFLPQAMKFLERDGVIWVSWPKKASKRVTDITEDTIRNFALTMGLVDVKVCAVDDIWSGLKLVIRKELR